MKPRYENPYANIDSHRVYLNQVTAIELLSPDEINILGEQVQAGLRAQQALQEEAIKNNEQRLALEAAVNEGAEAKCRMLEANLRLVVSRANRFVGSGMAVADLIQEGNLGLLVAIEKYDPQTIKNTFSTHATWWIDAAIRRSIDNQSRAVRVPVYMAERIRSIHRASGAMAQKLGRMPTNQEIAAVLEVSDKKLEDARLYGQRQTSLDAPLTNDDNEEMAQDFPDKTTVGQFDEVDSADWQGILREVVENLPERTRTVMWRMYGQPSKYGGNVVKDLAAEFNVSEVYIRQLGRETLKKLRATETIQHLKVYLED